jgi:hypothetical protein
LFVAIELLDCKRDSGSPRAGDWFRALIQNIDVAPVDEESVPLLTGSLADDSEFLHVLMYAENRASLVLRCIQRTLVFIGALACGMFGVADERLNGWHKGSRDQQKVEAENSDQIKQRVESRGDFPGFYGGNMDLWESYPTCEFMLAPEVGMARVDKGMPQIFRQPLENAQYRYAKACQISRWIYIKGGPMAWS